MAVEMEEVCDVAFGYRSLLYFCVDHTNTRLIDLCCTILDFFLMFLSVVHFCMHMLMYSVAVSFVQFSIICHVTYSFISVL